MHLREYPVDNPIRERVVAIPQQVFLVNVEVMVRI